MKLVRVCFEDHTGEERICIHTLELHPAQIERFRALGMIELEGDQISLNDLRRIRKTLRLRRSLGVTLTGAAVILELLEHIEDLEDELRSLRKGRVND
ncbi:MAG: hypothetical protein GYA86_02785 [Firmicutes bacterium]|jgi:MerR family transcriptional regulator/heat shock protein HspR|nr:hypothetical protein [Bacillota bacterium]